MSDELTIVIPREDLRLLLKGADSADGFVDRTAEDATYVEYHKRALDEYAKYDRIITDLKARLEGEA